MRLIALALMTALAAPAATQAQQQPPLPTRTGLSMEMPTLQEDEALQAAIASPARSEADRARDIFRHPYESLTFWGLQSGQTVVEVQPGNAGWWTGILRPYAEATGGRYIVADNLAALDATEPGAADMVLIARAFHNWARAPGRTDAVLAAAFKALEPGGVLAIEQHRAASGLNVVDTAPTGYVPQEYVVRAALAAGFVLEAESDLNANPADDHMHPYGVWSLKPNRVSAPREGQAIDRPTPLTPEERAGLDAIGESDRMTLRFRKPE
jgi:predicted methyltransferase